MYFFENKTFNAVTMLMFAIFLYFVQTLIIVLENSLAYLELLYTQCEKKVFGYHTSLFAYLQKPTGLQLGNTVHRTQHAFSIKMIKLIETLVPTCKKLFVAFPWVETSTGPGGFMICVFII